MEKTRDQTARSHLFNVRLWMEEVDENHAEIRGWVRHVLSQEYLIFRDWADLVGFLTSKTVANTHHPRPGDGATP